MSKLRQLFLVLSLVALFTGVSDGADKIALTCSGHVWDQTIKTSPHLVPKQSFIIDLNQNIVTFSTMGNFPITGFSDAAVYFKSNDGERDWEGSLDRYSGLAILEARVNKEPTMRSGSRASER